MAAIGIDKGGGVGASASGGALSVGDDCAAKTGLPIASAFAATAEVVHGSSDARRGGNAAAAADDDGAKGSPATEDDAAVSVGFVRAKIFRGCEIPACCCADA